MLLQKGGKMITLFEVCTNDEDGYINCMYPTWQL